MRIRDHDVDPRKNQAGFRPGRSCSQQIHILRRIMEAFGSYQLLLTNTFIDFKKAFDSINWSVMFSVLRHYGIPEVIVKSICVYFATTSTVVLVDGKCLRQSVQGYYWGTAGGCSCTIPLYCALRLPNENNNGEHWIRCQSSRHQCPETCENWVYDHDRQLQPSATITACCPKLAVHTLVTSRLDYCNSLLAGINRGLLKRLQNVQRTAARLQGRSQTFQNEGAARGAEGWAGGADRDSKWRLSIDLCIKCNFIWGAEFLPEGAVAPPPAPPLATPLPGWSPGRESMIPYRMILLNCIGCQWSKGLISRSWSLRMRLSTINHLITSPACFNYGLIPGTSAPHLSNLNLFSLELIISRLPIASFHVMYLANHGINCLLKSEMLIPSVSSKDFWNLISLNLLMDSSYVSFYCAKAP